MQLRYMGFEQANAVRVYRFDRIEERVPTVRYTVTADLTLFLKHHIGIQEGPALCARKLTSDLEGVVQCEHILTNDDLLSYVTARADADARKAAARRPGIRRRAPVRNEGWAGVSPAAGNREQ
jgi:hypothetical protein